MSKFLETDQDNMLKNLRFVDDPLQREINKIMGKFGEGETNVPQPNCKIIMPEPAFCIKFFHVNSEEKFFVNVCKTQEIPAPPIVTDVELAQLIFSDEEGSGGQYRVPMSITDPRWINDKAGKPAEAVDIAIHPQFISRVLTSRMYRDFLVTLITEAISEKYNHQLVRKTAVILQRPFIGSLVEHRIRTEEVKAVLDSNFTSKPLVTEMESKDIETTSIEPQFKFFIRESKDSAQVIAQFYMPECTSGRYIKVELSDDRIVISSPKNGYKFDRFIPFEMEDIEFDPTFNKITKILTIIVPVKSTKKVAADGKQDG